MPCMLQPPTIKDYEASLKGNCYNLETPESLYLQILHAYSSKSRDVQRYYKTSSICHVS